MNESEPAKLLFEHIPKCAGTTVIHFLTAQYFNKKHFFIDGSNPTKSVLYFKSLPKQERLSYDLVLGHHAHDLLDFFHPKKVTLTVFRDPVDRIISHYYFVLRSPDHYLHKEVTSKGLSLERYASMDLSAELRNNYVTRFLRIPIEEAERDSENAVACAYDIIRKNYTVVGILEKLDAAMNALADAAHFRESFKPSVLNATVNRPKY
jgi:hypothetical protein